MKSRSLFCAALAGGMIIGWFGRSASFINNEGHISSLTPRRYAMESSSARKGVAVAESAPPENVASFVTRALEAAARENEGLDDTAFGEKLAEMITREKPTLQDRVEAEAMKAHLTPSRFLAFYQAYTRRRAPSDGDNDLNPLLTEMGKKYGRQMIDIMKSKYPEGFPRMDSLIHGWAMTSPEQAVSWFNDLPDTYGRYDSALQGLLWGLTAKDGAMAGQVMSTLSASDRQKSMYSFASGFIHSHGLSSFDAWAREGPAELVGPAIANAPQFASYRPLEEQVPWFATHSNTLGFRPELQKGFDQWFIAQPTAALDWLAALPAEQLNIQSRLGSRVSPEALQKFISEHPNHPIANILNPNQ